MITREDVLELAVKIRQKPLPTVGSSFVDNFYDEMTREDLIKTAKLVHVVATNGLKYIAKLEQAVLAASEHMLGRDHLQ